LPIPERYSRLTDSNFLRLISGTFLRRNGGVAANQMSRAAHRSALKVLVIRRDKHHGLPSGTLQISRLISPGIALCQHHSAHHGVSEFMLAFDRQHSAELGHCCTIARGCYPFTLVYGRFSSDKGNRLSTISGAVTKRPCQDQRRNRRSSYRGGTPLITQNPSVTEAASKKQGLTGQRPNCHGVCKLTMSIELPQLLICPDFSMRFRNGAPAY
jgi:hypothetical protein